MTRVAVWSPLPPARSGIADYVAETLPLLAERFDVEVVVPEPAVVPRAVRERFRVCVPAESGAELDLFHVGNSPEHAYVYRAALARPGVVVLHEWNLHHLVLLETVERGQPTSYLREMRREHGAVGSLVGRQVARALGGVMLPALYPLNARLLEASLAVIGLTDHVADRVRRAIPDRPVLKLPHHLSLSLDPLPSRAEARARLGLGPEDEIITAPGLATRAKRLDVVIRVVGRMAARRPRLRLVVAGPVDPRLPLARWAAEAGLAERLVRLERVSMDDFVRHLVAADLVVALRFPSYGEISGALVRALGVGRASLVTAGTPAADEFPEGVVVPVPPGVHEERLLAALIERFLDDHGLRERVERLAREFVGPRHDLRGSVSTLSGFLEEVARDRGHLASVAHSTRVQPDSLAEFLLDEVRWYARSVGVPVSTLLPRLGGLVGEQW